MEVVGILPPGVELVFPPKSGIERLPDVWVAARIADRNAQRELWHHPQRADLLDCTLTRCACTEGYATLTEAGLITLTGKTRVITLYLQETHS